LASYKPIPKYPVRIEVEKIRNALLKELKKKFGASLKD
jgi:hypothetical protein